MRMPGKRWFAYTLLAIAAGAAVYLFIFGPVDKPLTESSGIAKLADTRPDEPVSSVVNLYFAARDNPFLMAEKRELSHRQDPVSFAGSIVAALADGPRGELARTLPADTALRTLFIDRNGIAYVDMTGPIEERCPGGIRSELFAVYSIVNSLVLNVTGIEMVKILIEGNEALTLCGHIDLDFPFKANMLLIR